MILSLSSRLIIIRQQYQSCGGVGGGVDFIDFEKGVCKIIVFLDILNPFRYDCSGKLDQLTLPF